MGTPYDQVLDEWFQDHKLKIMASTAYNYSKAIPLIKQYFSGACVQEMTAELLYDYVQWLLKNYSYTSARIYGKVLRLSFKYALKIGYIAYNVAEDVRIPKRVRAEIFPFSEAEMNAVLMQETLPWVRDAIYISYHTGMRLGEVFGLRWSDINFDVGFLMVQRSQSRACGKTILKCPKTKTGVRRIDIDSRLIQNLIRMKEDAGKCLYVFPPPPKGKYPFRIPHNISKYLRDMCINAGVVPRNFHQIRHTHATVLMSHGVHPKVVQERLGHSSIMITLDIYSHITPTIQKTAVNVFEKLTDDKFPYC